MKAAVKSDIGSPPLRSGATYQKTIKASPLSLANVPIPNKQDVRHEPNRTACTTTAAEGSTLLHSKRRPPTRRHLHTHTHSRVRSRARSECIKALCSTTMVKAFPASRERFKRQDVKARTCGSLARRCWPWREFAYRELIKRTRRFFTLRKPSGKQDMEGGGGWGGGGGVGVARVVVGVEGESSGAAPSPTASRYTEKPRRW